VLRSVRSPFAYFQATPADDLFALGVTAYCLVMGEYPPRPDPTEDMEGNWHLVRPDLHPLLERNPRVEPQLRECILRLLSMEPAARGTAAGLARILEPSAGHADVQFVPLSDAGLQPDPMLTDAASPTAKLTSGEEAPREHSSLRTSAGAWRLCLAVAAMGLSWVLGWSMRPSHIEPEPALTRSQDTPALEKPDTGPAAVGDSSNKASQDSAHVPAKQKPIAQDTLPKPLPRQAQTDEKGHCPGLKHVPLNGLCWLEIPGLTGDECKESGYAYVKGRCYAPVFTPPGKPQPTSDPPDSP
jgi:hypothetical protein